MLCRKCNEREVPASKLKKQDYICYCCSSRRYRANPKNLANLAAWGRKKYHEMREQLFTHYGKECTYCKSIEQLQLDHIDGDGKSVNRTSNGRTQWMRGLIENNYPSTCQVLCRRCNLAKQDTTDADFRQWIWDMACRMHPDKIIPVP